MILYGRDLSPFVRRVSVLCAMQDRQIQREPIMVQGEDFERLKGMNPLVRVPVLELDDGTQMIEAYAICDWLDETSPNGWRMLPAEGTARRDAFQRMAIAIGVAEKAVNLVYERNRRPEKFHWMEWQQRLVGQVQGGLAALDAAVGEDTPDGPELAAAIAYQFIEATNPWVLSPTYPRLAAMTERAMEIPAFAATKPSM